MVLEEVFSRIANDILLLDDIAAEETLQVRTKTFFCYLTRQLQTLHVLSHRIVWARMIYQIEVANTFLQFLDLIGWFFCLQLQRLIHLLFENLSSLLDSVLAINQTGKLQESPAQTLDDLMPSLRKLRKLAGILILGSAYSRMKWFSTLLFFLLLVIVNRSPGYAIEIYYCSLGDWWTCQPWF